MTSDRKAPAVHAKLLQNKPGQCLVLKLKEGDPLEVPWQKLAYPWDNSFYALSELSIPLPKEKPKDLAAKLQILAWTAISRWAAFHWVLRDGPTGGRHKLPPYRGLMSDSELKGKELLALLRLCESLAGWAPRHELPYLTAAHWWTMCVLDMWTCSVARALEGDQPKGKRQLRDALYRIGKYPLDIDPPATGSALPDRFFPVPAPHWRLLLDLAVQRAAIDHHFKTKVLTPYCQAFNDQARRWDSPHSTFTLIEEGDLLIRGNTVKRKKHPLIDEIEQLAEAAYPGTKI